MTLPAGITIGLYVLALAAMFAGLFVRRRSIRASLTLQAVGLVLLAGGLVASSQRSFDHSHRRLADAVAVLSQPDATDAARAEAKQAAAYGLTDVRDDAGFAAGGWVLVGFAGLNLLLTLLRPEALLSASGRAALELQRRERGGAA